MNELSVSALDESAAFFVTLPSEKGDLRIEAQWLGGAVESAASAAGNAKPLIVFLHEGLGSVAMWKDFPRRLCTALGCQGLLFSRPGYGRSTPPGAGDNWGTDFMHEQAHVLLPALLQALGVNASHQPLWLFGHSDGGSIALLYAARFANEPALAPAGLITLAPHIFVEDISVASIKKARVAYKTGDLKARLAKFHDDADSAFWGWNNVWLSPAFRAWSIEAELAAITCPVLAVQGLDDEYGTLAQVRGIAEVLPQTLLLELAHCGHSPHRDQSEKLTLAVASFMQHRRL